MLEEACSCLINSVHKTVTNNLFEFYMITYKQYNRSTSFYMIYQTNNTIKARVFT